MKKAAALIALTGLMLTIFGGTALALNLTGDDGPNRLVGTAENDTIRGLGGADALVGRGDSDRLFGGGGNDLINALDPGRPEGDIVDCGAGFDRALVDPGTEDVVRGNCERVRVG